MKDMDALQGSRVCVLLDLPDEVDAGAEVVFHVGVTTDPPADLAGTEVEIVDGTGARLATARLSPVGAAADARFHTHFETEAIAIPAPAETGPFTLAARLAPLFLPGEAYAGGGAGEPVAFPAVEAEATLGIVAHRVAPVVWDIPDAVVPGAAFTIRVGARCSSACDATGWAISVRDAEGRTLGEGVAGPEPWPGTDALRHAEIRLVAPNEVGLVNWQAVVEARGAAAPHVAGTRRFGVQVRPPADARLRVEAVDTESGAPVEGLKVVVHPFTARTGPDGRAALDVPSGTHRVFVSGGHYIPFALERAIEGEEVLRVEMEPDTGPTDAMMWG